MSRDDFYASPFGVAYSAYAERRWLNRLIARTVWGGDTRHYYESMGAIREVADGGTIVDCPCGAGVALRELDPGKELRYVAVDLSPSMLRRARKRIANRRLSQVELLRADATEIPLPADSVDLFLSYWGLHCFDDPAAALTAAARTLKPGVDSSVRPSSTAATACANVCSSGRASATSATPAPPRRSPAGSGRWDSKSPASSAQARCCSSTPA